MNVPPSLKAADLDALIKELLKPRIVGTDSIDVSLMLEGLPRPFTGRQTYETPRWEPSSYYDGTAGVAGRLSGYDVLFDHNCITPRMQVSRRFVEIQDPKLVEETQDWMNSFFGVDYPIHLYAGKLVMHPEALRKLLRTLDEQHDIALKGQT